jgi:hypothetical protein
MALGMDMVAFATVISMGMAFMAVFPTAIALTGVALTDGR